MACKKGKRHLPVRILIGLLAFCVCAPAPAAADTWEGPGWDTPEEAVLYYLEGLKEQDLDKMIGAYAVETYVDSFDMAAQIGRIGVFTMSMMPRMPNTGSLLRSINIEDRKREIVQSVYLQLTSVCLPEADFSYPVNLTGGDGDEAKTFVEQLEEAYGAVDFGALRVVGFIPPETISEVYASDRNQEMLSAQIAPSGADEARSLIASFTLEGKVCALFCDAVRYGDRWFIKSSLGNASMLAGVTPLTGGMLAIPAEEVADFLRNTLGGDAQELMDMYLGALFGG